MAPPKRPWFRFYVEAFGDMKLRRLKPEHRWLFAACCGAARQSPVPPRLMVTETHPMTIDDLAAFVGMPVRQVAAGLEAMTGMGLVVSSPDGGWSVPAFMARQFESDNSAARTSKWRRSDGGCDDDVTHQKTEADTETEAAADAVVQEASRRVESRRRRGEDIGPGLEARIRGDVARDLAMQRTPEPARPSPLDDAQAAQRALAAEGQAAWRSQLEAAEGVIPSDPEARRKFLAAHPLR